MANLKSIILVAVILILNQNILYSAYTWYGDDKWKITLFAGPGKGENRVTSITSSDYETTGVYKIYGICSDKLPYPHERQFVYEFYWDGNTWQKNRIQEKQISVWAIPRLMGFYNARNNPSVSLNNMYFMGIDGCLYEYEKVGNEWNNASEINKPPRTSDADMNFTSFAGFTVSKRTPSGENYVYIADYNSQFIECKWESNTWEIKNRQNFYEYINKLGNRSVPNTVYMVEGNVRDNSSGKYLYQRYLSRGQINELHWNGTSWEKTAEILLGTKDGDLGSTNISPTMFFTDLGKGKRMYTLGQVTGLLGIYECWIKSNKWQKKLAIEFPRYSIIAGITYGKISKDDPYSIYVLFLKSGVNDHFSSNIADEIHEYTCIKNKWYETFIVKLTQDGMTDFVKGGHEISEFLMVNGRNEKETIKDEAGNDVIIDRYNRMYIVDSWGNMWESSIPPRLERPPDPTGLEYGLTGTDPGDNYEDPDKPEKDKPSIMGK